MSKTTPKFIYRKATKLSLAKRKPLYGIGINDAWYIIYNKSKDGVKRCPYYVRWASMIQRVYSNQDCFRCYYGTSVCKEWHSFTTFKEWMEQQDWEGMELDKDKIIPGNKIYSPETCVFIPKEENKKIRKTARIPTNKNKY